MVGRDFSPSGFQTMAAAGVQARRPVLSWAYAQPQPGVLDWSAFDPVVESAARAGIETVPLVLGTPTWVDPLGKPPVYSGPQQSAWGAFLRAAAARYGPTGSFWAQNPQVPYLPVRNWQVWNEPNLRVFCGGKPDPKGYAQLLEISHKALQGVDPAAQVIAAGIFRRPARGGGITSEKYLEGLYRVRGAKKDFDAVALHPYAGTPKNVLKTLIRVLRRRGV